jgi:signal transduction histidine kinase/putative methionine-R-sulfoxide reductase with GAF domain
MAGNVRETSADPQREIARLQREVGQLRRDLAAALSREAEALEQQTATSEILRVISQSPSDVQPVMDSIVEHAARLADADHAFIGRAEGDEIRWLAAYGTPLAWEGAPISRALPSGRAMLDCQTTQVADIAALADQFPTVGRAYRELGVRTILATPLLREGAAIGVLLMRRLAVRPFTDQQIELLKTFADQAVIAIENTRLFQDLQDRNRDLAESLEQQTATSEILRVIASSPTDLQRVLDVVAENAARLCAATEALIYGVDCDNLRKLAAFGSVPSPVPVGAAVPLSRRTVICRAVLDRKTVHVHDLAAVVATEFPDSRQWQQAVGYRTALATPLMRQGVSIGVINIRRLEVRPFTEQQIKLLETFADQAVIAIENTRLFQDLQDRNRDLAESLEQQTATAEILRVIASSPTDLHRVLDAVVDHAARLCAATGAQIQRLEQDQLRRVAAFGTWVLEIGEATPVGRGWVPGRAMLERRTIHVPDLAAVVDTEYPDAAPFLKRYGHRALIFTPLLRQGAPIGMIGVGRREPMPFTDEQIKLLETFADQAVIAIENTRLFQELEQRTRELARSVEELKALGEVGQAVSSTLDLQELLETVVAHADRLSGTDGGSIYEYDEATELFYLRATRAFDAELAEILRATPLKMGEGSVGRAAATRGPVQIPDIAEEGAFQSRLREVLTRAGYRAVLALPLLREDRILGSLVVSRRSPGEFPPNVVELVRTFASQSALAIQNARLFREIEDKSLQLEVASRHKSEFLANMSHELRTPLNAIIGFSEVLVEKMFGELNDKQEEYLTDILSSGKHLLSLINDILDLSKVEAGRMELEVGRFSLREALGNGLTMLKERAGRHGIGLGLEIDPDLDLIEADERKVKQVVFNLLSNAVKFTPDGGRVDVAARRVDGEVEVAVSDTGIGIAPDDQAHVFEEFRQVGRGTAKAEGTGLGLPLAKRFVELHGGSMWVESAVGQGSTFTFALPLRPPAASDDGTAPQPAASGNV